LICLKVTLWLTTSLVEVALAVLEVALLMYGTSWRRSLASLAWVVTMVGFCSTRSLFLLPASLNAAANESGLTTRSDGQPATVCRSR